jgi:hypothetical protein
MRNRPHFCLHFDRPTMVPIAGFLIKSTPCNIYLQFIHISSFFHIFPKPCGAGRDICADTYAISLECRPQTVGVGRVSDRCPHMRIFSYF